MATAAIEAGDSDVANGGNPVRLVVKSLYNFAGSPVAVKPGKNFADYERPVSPDCLLHTLKHICLKVLHIDLDQIHARRVTAFIVVEGQGFNFQRGRAVSVLPTVADERAGRFGVEGIGLG